MLAEELNLNIEEDADELINERSPEGSRQILRKYNVKHEYVPFSFSDLTTPGPDMAGQDFMIPTFRSRAGASMSRGRRGADLKEDDSDFSSSSFCSSSSSEEMASDAESTPRINLGQLNKVEPEADEKSYPAESPILNESR